MKEAFCLIIGTLLFCSIHAKPLNIQSYQVNAKPGCFAAKDSTQSDSTSDDDDENRMYAIGLEYASDQEHYGLKNNSYKLPYLEPSFTYTAPKGFYTEISDEYFFAPQKIKGFDDLSINPGWSFDLSDNNSLNVDWTHYFIRNSPEIITSGMSNTLETFFVQWIGNLKGKFTVDYDTYLTKSTPNDVALTPDLLYKFKWKLGEKSAIKLKPEVSMDFGTRNFYTQYIINKQNDTINTPGEKLKGKKEASNSNSSFGALDYNLVLTIDFVLGKFDISPAFNYTDPLYKPSNLPAPPNGYLTLSVTYTISTK